MREIANACNLTPAAFYNHFAGKDDLLLSLIIGSFDQLETAISSMGEVRNKSASLQLRLLVQIMTTWHYENSEQARVVNREIIELTPEMLKPAMSRWRRLRSIPEDIITLGVEQGELDLPGAPTADVVRMMATSILDLVRSGPEAQHMGDAWSPREFVELYTTIVLRMVGATS
jgi:AcrR family transcriptional regulator